MALEFGFQKDHGETTEMVRECDEKRRSVVKKVMRTDILGKEDDRKHDGRLMPMRHEKHRTENGRGKIEKDDNQPGKTKNELIKVTKNIM